MARALLLGALVLLTSALHAPPAPAQVVSTFDFDLESWTIIGDNNAVWQPIGGNPDGYLDVNDKAIGAMNIAAAPAKFLGDWSAFTAANTVSFDVYFENTSGRPLLDIPYLFRISGPGGAAHALAGQLNIPPQYIWYTAQVSLDPADWTVESGTWSTILADVTSLQLGVEYVDGAEEVHVDNVILSGTPVHVFNPCAASTFSDGTVDDWSFLNANGVTVHSSGGNGGHYLSVADRSGVNSYGLAPSRFLGDWSSLDGNGYITIDIRIVSFSGTNVGSPYFITLTGPGGSAHVSLVAADLPENRRIWKRFVFPLHNLTWMVDSGTWSGLLAWVDECRVDLEYFDGSETIGMDNFGRLADACPEIDQTVVVHDPNVHICRWYSLVEVNGIALNPLDHETYAVVENTTSSGGGVYTVTGYDNGLKVQSYDRPSGLIFDTDGDCFVSRRHDGEVFRLAWGGGSSLWVSGFHSDDDDPVCMAFAPPGFDGPNVSEGDVIITDHGYNGADEIWTFSPDVAEGEKKLVPDPGNVDWWDVTSAPTGEVYVCDGLDPDSLYSIDINGNLAGLALSTPLTDLRSVAYDEIDQVIYVAERGGMSVRRVDPSTGAVTPVADGFVDLKWGCLEVDSSRRRVWVADKGYNRVYELCIGLLTAVDDRPQPRSSEGVLRIVPNPFNPSTSVYFELDRPEIVRLEIYDVTGRFIRSLVDGQMREGTCWERWDGRDARGNEVASGIYYVLLETSRQTLTRKAVLLR